MCISTKTNNLLLQTHKLLANILIIKSNQTLNIQNV